MKVAKVSQTYTASGESDTLISRQTVLRDEGTSKKPQSKDTMKKTELSLKDPVHMHVNMLMICVSMT